MTKSEAYEKVLTDMTPDQRLEWLNMPHVEAEEIMNKVIDVEVQNV